MELLTLALLIFAANSVPDHQPAAVTKFLTLFDQLRAAQTSHQHVAFRFTDAEVDEYMRYSLKATPRPGLESFTLKVFPANYISTFTVIDFDAVEKWHPGTIPTVLRPVLTGKKSIWVDYRIQANDSKMTFTVEKAHYQDIRIPAFLVNKVIEIVAARQPEKYDTSKPMPIPFGLKQIWTSGNAIEGQN